MTGCHSCNCCCVCGFLRACVCVPATRRWWPVFSSSWWLCCGSPGSLVSYPAGRLFLRSEYPWCWRTPRRNKRWWSDRCDWVALGGQSGLSDRNTQTHTVTHTEHEDAVCMQKKSVLLEKLTSLQCYILHVGVFLFRKGYRTDATVSVLLGFLLFLIPARRPFSSSSSSSYRNTGQDHELVQLTVLYSVYLLGAPDALGLTYCAT